MNEYDQLDELKVVLGEAAAGGVGEMDDESNDHGISSVAKEQVLIKSIRPYLRILDDYEDALATQTQAISYERWERGVAVARVFSSRTEGGEVNEGK